MLYAVSDVTTTTVYRHNLFECLLNVGCHAQIEFFIPRCGLLIYGRYKLCAVFVCPCHQDMARPQVADGGTASDMEGSCE